MNEELTFGDLLLKYWAVITALSALGFAVVHNWLKAHFTIESIDKRLDGIETKLEKVQKDVHDIRIKDAVQDEQLKKK